MAKLYFKYGAMGSSKTARALITKFNYEERGMKVLLLKPSTDTRDGENVIKSRIGLSAKCLAVGKEQKISDILDDEGRVDVIIADEAQFFTREQVDELRDIVDERGVPVLCYGLRTDFRTRFFPGSERLMEIADCLSEIKTICACGAKATVSARLDKHGKIVTAGAQVELGGNDRYVAMCHRCFHKAVSEQEGKA